MSMFPAIRAHYIADFLFCSFVFDSGGLLWSSGVCFEREHEFYIRRIQTIIED